MANYHNHFGNGCKYITVTFLLSVQNYPVPDNSAIPMRPFKEQLESQEIIEENYDMYKYYPSSRQ